jgi:hypothetical protein
MLYLTSNQVVSHLRANGLINAIIGAATTWRSVERNSAYTDIIVKIRIPAKCGVVDMMVLEERFVYSDGSEFVNKTNLDVGKGNNFHK